MIIEQHRHFFTSTSHAARNTERVSVKFGEVTTSTNRGTDYILGEIVPGTREQDMTKKL